MFSISVNALLKSILKRRSGEDFFVRIFCGALAACHPAF